MQEIVARVGVERRGGYRANLSCGEKRRGGEEIQINVKMIRGGERGDLFSVCC